MEITSRCDLGCPVCLVDAGRPWDMTREEFQRVLDGLVRAEKQVDVLNLSGGEPLLHPALVAFLDEALARPEVVRVSVSTNGLALLENPGLLQQLRDRSVVLSLQFDGFDDRAYRVLRGRSLLKEKLAILDLLAAEAISIFPGYTGLQLLAGLDCHEVAVSIGSACTADRIEPSHVSLGMGLSEKLALSAIRISMGSTTRAADITYLLWALKQVLKGMPEGFRYLDPQHLTEEKFCSQNAFLIDLRLPYERLLSPSIPGARLWSHIGFEKHFREIPWDREVVMMCSTGIFALPGGLPFGRGRSPSRAGCLRGLCGLAAAPRRPARTVEEPHPMSREQAHDLCRRYVNPDRVQLLETLDFGRSFVRAQDTRLYDDMGREYVDFLAGFGVHDVGHNHPRLLAALRQAPESSSPSMLNVDAPLPVGELAEKLTSLTHPALCRTALANSAGEAVDIAIKAARSATGGGPSACCGR